AAHLVDAERRRDGARELRPTDPVEHLGANVVEGGGVAEVHHVEAAIARDLGRPAGPATDTASVPAPHRHAHAGGRRGRIARDRRRAIPAEGAHAEDEARAAEQQDHRRPRALQPATGAGAHRMAFQNATVAGWRATPRSTRWRMRAPRTSR